MPERLLLTGGPEEAAAQLIADLERRGIMKRLQPAEEEAEENLAGWHRMLDKWREVKCENEELKRKNAILEGQIATLLKLNAESAQPNVAGGRRGRARRGNMDTILEASPP